jgi:hypothetical protein
MSNQNDTANVVTRTQGWIINIPSAQRHSAVRNNPEPGTFVLVKENRAEVNQYGVWSTISKLDADTPTFDKDASGEQGFSSEFIHSAAVTFPTRQATVVAAMEHGGVPHTYLAGWELLSVGNPAYVLEPSGSHSLELGL